RVGVGLEDELALGVAALPVAGGRRRRPPAGALGRTHPALDVLAPLAVVRLGRDERDDDLPQRLGVGPVDGRGARLDLDAEPPEVERDEGEGAGGVAAEPRPVLDEDEGGALRRPQRAEFGHEVAPAGATLEALAEAA